MTGSHRMTEAPQRKIDIPYLAKMEYQPTIIIYNTYSYVQKAKVVH